MFVDLKGANRIRSSLTTALLPKEKPSEPQAHRGSLQLNMPARLRASRNGECQGNRAGSGVDQESVLRNSGLSV
jgi:hypothetical protein